ncbi:MAG: peptide deformylase [Gammaproteobacteria bacterium]|nr:peptide deformylase [Gammaproteobacteria bacterium]MCF6230644.1 peptide deformylase [Gammaproteobacteria bacterium]
MALLEILTIPDPRLHKVAKPVAAITPKILSLLDDLLATMYQAPGIGLAATQVNIHQRIVVIDISEEKNQPLILINPEIITHDGLMINEEGCLSIPGVYEDVERAENITVKALNRHDEEILLDADGLLSVCIQHEIDHLNGKVFIDHISPLKRRRIKKKLEKIKRQPL